MDQLPLFAPANLTVTELTRYLRGLVEKDELLQDVWVLGEISNLSTPSSGHIYFTLKDAGASLRCVVWRSSAQRLRRLLSNGTMLEAHGAISIYPEQGSYQLYIDSARPAGEGLLFQEFLRLKERLESEGLFDPGRKRPLPPLPRCIGIVTSPTGAALQDMLNTLRLRYPLAKVVLAPCAVQGEEAPLQIIAAFRALNTRAKPDVILVARGGGSLEDLWAFNDENVVRVIARSPVPVVSGIGHETDFTLSDFAADVRAPTPTGAAVIATPDIAELRQSLVTLTAQMAGVFNDALEKRRKKLFLLRQRLKATSPRWHIQTSTQRLDELEMRLVRAAKNRLKLEKMHWQFLSQRLNALNPLSVLERGFALVSDTNGHLVRSTAQVHSGDTIHVRLSDGSFPARVTNPAPGSHSDEQTLFN